MHAHSGSIDELSKEIDRKMVTRRGSVFLAAIALVVISAARADGCDATAFQQDTDTKVKAYKKITTASPLDCCTACTADAACDFFSFDGTSSKDNCHKKKGSMTGRTLVSANFTTSAAPVPPPTPPTPAPTRGPHWGSKPNVIVFFSDDTGWGDLGANGVAPSETPNLDALAASGLRFTDWHAGASVCTPSRAALLTGRLGARTGVTHNFGIASTMGLDLDEKTIAEVVKPAGYDTKVRYALLLGVDARAFVVRASSFSPLRCAACGRCPRINHASLFTNACVRTNTFNQSHR